MKQIKFFSVYAIFVLLILSLQADQSTRLLKRQDQKSNQKGEQKSDLAALEPPKKGEKSSKKSGDEINCQDKATAKKNKKFCDEQKKQSPRKAMKEKDVMKYYHKKENPQLKDLKCDLIRDEEKREKCFRSKLNGTAFDDSDDSDDTDDPDDDNNSQSNSCSDSD